MTTTTKRQLRAEAVERLKEYHDWEPSQKSLANITLPIWPMSSDMNNDQRIDALIDLLEEDELPEGDAPSEFAEILMRLAADCSCMGDGIVRHFEPKDVQNDVDALMRVVKRDYVKLSEYERATRDAQELYLQVEAERDELRAKYDKDVLVIVDELDRWKTRAVKLEAERDEWKAKAEAYNPCGWWNASLQYCECNDDLPPKNDVRADAVDANDGNATQDSRDSRIRKGLGYKDFPPHEPSEATKRFIEELDAELDSREKLEADITHQFSMWFGNSPYPSQGHRTAVEWLDRQDAITEREWETEQAYINSGYKERIAELQDQLESAHAKNRALKAHISKMQEGRHGWHIKAAKLQAQVDKLTAECGECVYKQEFASIDELQIKVDALTQANSDYREEWHRVSAERDKLNRELHACNRERESLRKQLGIAIDHAHDMIALVNLNADDGR